MMTALELAIESWRANGFGKSLRYSASSGYLLWKQIPAERVIQSRGRYRRTAPQIAPRHLPKTRKTIMPNFTLAKLLSGRLRLD